jgi:hypothetical protein
MTASDHLSPGQFFHGTHAELNSGDLIEPGKHPKSYQPYKDAPDLQSRDHVYFSNRRQYLAEYYGPNLYQVEPTGPHTRDPEYSDRRMRRSKDPLRVVRKVSKDWGEPL